MSDAIKNHWNSTSDEYYTRDIDSYEAIIASPERAFPLAVYPLIQKYVGALQGKRVCVPSNGDNIAAFGFFLLGAKVTSCDLSENQIANAQKIADKYRFDVEFVCDDSMTLGKVRDDTYDLVYTSNGVHVWIDNLPGMYRNFHRVLKRGGYNIFFETHPMSRPFDDKTYEVKIKKPYEAIGPDEEMPTYDWRTQDFVNAIASAGFMIKEMQEFHSLREDLKSHNYLILSENSGQFNWPGDTFDWHNNPWAALPQCLSICSQKL